MNLTMLLDMAVDAFGDRRVVGNRSDGITASRLRGLAVAGAEQLRTAGADSLVYLAVNGPAFPVAMFAAAFAGVPLVPVNYRLGAAQVDQLLANHPNAFAVGDANHAATLSRNGLPHRTPDRWISELMGASPANWEAATTESPAAIIYTSGTTSAPKGVVLHHHNLVSYVLNTAEFAAANTDEAALISVPPYHIAAVSNVLTNLYAGRRLIALESFAPTEWLATVKTEGVTHAMVVPTMLARIMDSSGLDLSVPTLRSLSYGGARMPHRVIERALKEWPSVDFVNAYGLTETSSTISLLGPDEHRAAMASGDPAVKARLSSVGQPLPSVEIEIRDENGQVVAPGNIGRIFVRGEQVSSEYTETGASVDADGFFDTRDRGRFDADGYLYVSGRVDDTIIRGAENIAPAEIEDVLLRHPDIVDAVVVGVPDDEWGQRIAAVIVPRPGAEVDTAEVRQHVRGLLRGSKTPDHVACWTDLPRTSTGKVVRREVVETLSAREQDPTKASE